MNSNSFSEKKYSDSRWVGDSKPENTRTKIVLELIGSDKTVLDVGSYEGKFSTLIKENGNKVYACDATPQFEQKYIDSGITFKKNNLEEALPYESDFFDSVFAGEVIEHLVDTDNFVKEMHRVLKPEGHLIITTPNSASLARRLMLLFGKNPFFEASFTYPDNGVAGHLRYFTFDLLIGFIESKGFKIEIITSDVINMLPGFSSATLAKIFPRLGRTIILKCRKK